MHSMSAAQLPNSISGPKLAPHQEMWRFWRLFASQLISLHFPALLFLHFVLLLLFQAVHELFVFTLVPSASSRKLNGTRVPPQIFNVVSTPYQLIDHSSEMCWEFLVAWKQKGQGRSVGVIGYSLQNTKKITSVVCSPATSESYFVLTKLALEQLWGGKNPALSDPTCPTPRQSALSISYWGVKTLSRSSAWQFTACCCTITGCSLLLGCFAE